MRLTADEIQYISRKIVKTLVAAERLEVDDEARVVEGIARVIVDELAVEDRLNDEAREVLAQHMTPDGALRHHLLGDVPQGEARARQEEGDRAVKLSREKVLHMSHLILGYLDKDDGVEYFDEPQEIRQTIVKIIMDEMKNDEAIDALVRKKLETQKRDRRGLRRVGRALPQVLRGRDGPAPQGDAVAATVACAPPRTGRAGPVSYACPRSGR